VALAAVAWVTWAGWIFNPTTYKTKKRGLQETAALIFIP